MAKQSKRMTHLVKQVETLGTLPVAEAVVKLKGLEESLPPKIKRTKFDQTVEVAVRLGVDPKQADQIVRGSIVLPHGIGKSKTVLVFAQGANADAAKAAGADYVGGKDLVSSVRWVRCWGRED
jgi:large subunit ribosomal protein L1